MRAEDTEREEIEYQYLTLPGSPSNAKAEENSGEGEGEEAKDRREIPLSLEIFDEQEELPSVQEEEQPSQTQEIPLAPVAEEPNAEKPLPEEPDLELLARQIREEMDRKGEQEAPEPDTPQNGGETVSEDDGSIDVAEEDLEEDPSAEKEETPEQVRIRRIRGIFEYVETFCVALGVMILLFMFVFRYVSVDGDSMLPTLHGGDSSDHADRLIISGFLYEPKTGDVIVINTGTSEQPLIKRVIATGGQTVRIDFKAWEVSVDGVLLEEDYIWYREGQSMVERDMASMYGVDENGVCEFTVGEGKVFVMGDNRNNSKDSRFWEIGEQDVEHILGKVILRLYPLKEFGSV